VTTPAAVRLGLERAVGSRARHGALAALAGGLAAAGAGLRDPVAPALGVLAVLACLRLPRPALVAAALVAAGVGAGAARLAAIDGPGARLHPGQRIAGTAHLLTPLRPGPFGSSVEVRMATGAARGTRLSMRLGRGQALPSVAPGAEVVLVGYLRRPRPARYAGFDVRAYQRRRGIAGEVPVTSVRLTGGRRGGFTGAVDRARERGRRAIAHGLSPPEAALAEGMVLGQDERIDSSVRDDFRASGLAHVLAVSGQNVMLLAALALPLLAALGVGPRLRLVAAIALIGLYVPLAGAGPSLQRAGVMGAASLGALAAARPASRWYALLLAGCVTLAVNPRAAEDPGWQLSFAAVAGILLLAPLLRGGLGALPRPLAEGIAVTVAATVSTAPLMAHHFGSVALAGLPANVVALPLVAPIMWLGMVRAALGQLGPAADPLVDLTGIALAPALDGLGAVARAFADMPGGRLAPPLHSRAAVGVAYALLGAAGVLVRRVARRTDTAPLAGRWRRAPAGLRRLAVCGAAGAGALGLGALLAPPGPPSRFTVSFLDVGQGDATLVQAPGGVAVLFDGGPPEGGVLGLLRRAGVRRLALVVATHQSRDHHGGLQAVADSVPIGTLLENGDGTRDRSFWRVVSTARRAGARVIEPVPGEAIRTGRLTIRVYGPPPRPPGPPPEDPNPRAIAAVVSYGAFDLFLSGDAESDGLAGYALPPVDAMKVSHHGSADPGLPGLLQRLRPRVAGIEVGAHNTYGHPAPGTLAALGRAGVATYRTDRDGTTRLTIGDDGRLQVKRGG
jgi:competence protein ComEC